MTQEEKAKAYDEALKKAKAIVNSINVGLIGKDSFEAVFPELKESENKGENESKDEKIRKELISHFCSIRNNCGKDWYGYDINDVISWLEKQGEQKPADKIEPKFKIEKGKWYVCIKDLLDDYANKAFNKGDIYLSIQDGSLIPSNSNVPYKVVCPDTYFRNWTIQDVKDGDVLACNNGWSCIFKTLVNDETFSSYCFMDSTKWFCGTGGCHTLKEEFVKAYNGKIYPATKEQRDTLFKKMKEAGYEWNAAKKVLKKTDTFCQDNCKGFQETGRCFFDEECKAKKEHSKQKLQDNNFYRIEQSSTKWTKEDEVKLKSVCALIRNTNLNGNEGVVDSTIAWIKSLKSRIQLKQESASFALEKLNKEI